MQPMLVLCVSLLVAALIDRCKCVAKRSMSHPRPLVLASPYRIDRPKLYVPVRAELNRNDGELVSDGRTDSHDELLAVRRSWDSNEDQYFKWAKANRRPMESLAGRKRRVHYY